MAEYTVKELVFNHEKAFIPEKAAGLEAVVQYHLTGDEGGDYIITIGDDKCSVQEGDDHDRRWGLLRRCPARESRRHERVHGWQTPTGWRPKPGHEINQFL